MNANEKAMLVIDMPKSCSECNVGDNHFTDNTFICEKVNMWFKEFTYEDYLNKRHPQCPLQDTTELLEALEELRHSFEWKKDKAYNKIKTALGGKE